MTKASQRTNKLELPENWDQMTPAQKRKYRLDRFINAEGVNFISEKAKKNYKTRAKRLVAAYNVQEPDRVPVVLQVGNLPLQYAGISGATALRDYEKVIEAYETFNEKYAEDLECYAVPGASSSKVLEILDYKLFAWPGHGIPDNSPGFQYIEGEYMRADEYDDLIRDPSDFWIRKYLPRVFGALEPFNLLPPVTDILENVQPSNFMALTDSRVVEALQKLIDIGKEYKRLNKIMEPHMSEGEAHGFPLARGAFGKAPFDILGDTLRGTEGIMKDMFRCPDKLLKAMDVVADINIAKVLKSAQFGQLTMVGYPLHKGADGWMSQKQFDTFYWPPLKKMMDAFIKEGLIQRLFAEGSYETRLAKVNEFDKGDVLWYFDRTDMSLAKKYLGDKCCIMGNVPSSLLLTGTAKNVKVYSRQLIEKCGKGGGYILAPGVVGTGVKIENLRAIVETAKEYGVYK